MPLLTLAALAGGVHDGYFNEGGPGDELFASHVHARVTEAPNGVEAEDLIDFRITPKRSGDLDPFEGTRADFEIYTADNLDDLLAMLFPASIAEGVTGGDAAQGHSQSFVDRLLEQPLRRSTVGGLREDE